MRLAKIILLLLTSISWAQEQFVITGNFERITQKEIVLKGYNGLEEFELDKTTTDTNGQFTLKYPATYQGAALIEIVQGKKLIVLLNRENFQIDGTDLNSTKNIQFTGSVENVTFDYGLSVYQNTQEKKAGISHLLPYYTNEPKKSEFFKSELAQLNEVLPKFLQEIPSQSYVHYYLKLRFLIADFQKSIFAT